MSSFVTGGSKGIQSETLKPQNDEKLFKHDKKQKEQQETAV